MSVAQAMTRGQAHAEALMVDACLVERKAVDGSGEPIVTQDPTTLQNTYTWTTVYSGKCRVQRGGAQGLDDTVAGQKYLLTRPQLQLPVTAGAVVQVDDRVTITTATYDPALQDTVMTVRDDFSKTHPVMRRLDCEVVTA